MGIYRDYISEEADMQTILFRYSIMVDVFDTRLPPDMKCEHKLSEDLKKKILRKPYTEQIDRLIFLYGTGVITEEALKNLVLHNNSNFLSDVIAVENEVRKNEGESEKDVLSYNQLQKLLLLCANSKKFENMTTIDFDSTLELASANHILITEDGFIKCDSELLTILNDMGEPFGFYNADEDLFVFQESRYVAQTAEDDLDMLSEEYPAAAALISLKCCLSVYDNLYGKEFIIYAKENSIPFDDNFSSEYEKYLNDIKLSFEIKGFPKKRDICGEKINYYDYSVIEDNTLSDPNADDDYSTVIHLDTDDPLEESELTSKALRKYKNSRQCLEDMIIEVTHGGKTDIYIYRNGSFTAVNVGEFRRQLFDFNKIWSIIQMCSRNKKIRKVGDVITLPLEYMEEIPPEQRRYANNMIKEQYRLMYRQQQSNKHLQTLNDIRKQANNNMQKIAEEKAQQAAEKAAKRAERNQGLAKISKPAEN